MPKLGKEYSEIVAQAGNNLPVMKIPYYGRTTEKSIYKNIIAIDISIKNRA